MHLLESCTRFLSAGGELFTQIGSEDRSRNSFRSGEGGRRKGGGENDIRHQTFGKQNRFQSKFSLAAKVYDVTAHGGLEVGLACESYVSGNLSEASHLGY